MALRIRLEALIALLVVLALCIAFACTPAQVAAIPLEEKAVCVELRALDPSSGALSVVCATADMLAPFVPVLLEELNKPAAPPVAKTAAPLVAFAMPAPSRPHARRRCLPLASSSGLDAGGGDAGDGGGDGGR